MADEPFAEQQIARQVADEGQFGSDGEIGAEAPGFARRFHDQPAIALKIANGRVDLKESDFHDRPASTDYSVKRYFNSTQSATNPSRHVIFLPSL